MTHAVKHKTIILRFRQVNRDVFDAIKNGIKKVETRAATERYRSMKVGDTLVFRCGKNSSERRVQSVEIFRTLAALFRKHKVTDINPKAKSAEELEKIYYSYSGYCEKIKKYGLIALVLHGNLPKRA